MLTHTSFEFLLEYINGTQEKAFTFYELSSIAWNLPCEWNYAPGPSCRAYYNIIAGNYDANVLQRLLQTRGAALSDCAHPSFNNGDFINLNEPELVGLILNRGELENRCCRHWAAVIKLLDGVWINLDSHLEAPFIIGGNDEAKHFIQREFESGTRVIRVLVDPSRIWLMMIM
ncbi:hypothetical protein L7F22_061192 [Adiantum nelumboides]|nr:hypothetical protein [Adiantum nelumboides]